MDLKNVFICILSVILVVLIVFAGVLYVDLNKIEVETVEGLVISNTSNGDSAGKVSNIEENVMDNSSDSDDDSNGSKLTDDELQELIKENQEADKRQVCPSCGVYTGTEGKYCVDCYKAITGESEYNGGWL